MEGFDSGEEIRGAVECFSAEQPWSVFLESRKQRRAGVIFPGAKNLQHQFFVAAEQPDLYADWVRS